MQFHLAILDEHHVGFAVSCVIIVDEREKESGVTFTVMD